ncbi:hypothetical protein MKJ04_16680 [Pontibacter sp. E15-1]|uniref:transposase n=1 Tax=Pontibacter sp. E15-1 TaxID=2919918 RepID=UPI001F4F39B4|nr:transposase [Pontibacter sp. E15-1]MCJ8166483.1 hypothetical protein [Pontibacter sp. E15-1]
MHYFGSIPEQVETQNLASLPSAEYFHGADKTQIFAFLRYTAFGEIANQYWQEIPKHFPFVELDEFIVMPHHIHGIIFINKAEQNVWQPNKFGPQSQNLASIIRGYKAAVKKHATLQQLDFAWQPRYYDRVIRSEKELQNIRQYIFNNPAKWETEKHNPENLLM